MKKVVCIKCGAVQETNAIYTFYCKPKKGGCGKYTSMGILKVIKNGEA